MGVRGPPKGGRGPFMGVRGLLEGDRGSFLGPRSFSGRSRTFFGVRGPPEGGRGPFLVSKGYQSWVDDPEWGLTCI